MFGTSLLGDEHWKILAHQGLSSHCFAYKLHELFVHFLGKLCTHVYNLVKESAIAMTLLDTHIHSGGHSNSRVPLKFDVLKFSSLSNLSEEGHEDLKQEAIFPLIGKRVQPDIVLKGWCDRHCPPGRQSQQ